MARVNKMSVQKRLRERKKAEKAELKREMKNNPMPEPDEGPTSSVATRDDLEGYGMINEPEEEPETT